MTQTTACLPEAHASRACIRMLGAPSSRDESSLLHLLAGVAEGNERAMAQLFRALLPGVMAFARRQIGCSADADEVVAETMVEVWKQAGRFRRESKVTTWVLGIARHKAMLCLRSRASTRWLTMDCEVDLIADDAPDAFEHHWRCQREEQVTSAMRSLPDVQRQCLHLAVFEEMPLAEIAILQGCPENTVKTRLFHARRRLRDLLSRHGTPAQFL